MSTIDQNSQNSLSAILDKLGVNRADEKKQAGKNSLGQEDFLKFYLQLLQSYCRRITRKGYILVILIYYTIYSYRLL